MYVYLFMENQEPKKPETITHPVIKPEAIIKIEVSEFYLRRCQKLLIALSGHMGNDKFIETLKKLEEEKPLETLDEAILDVVLPLVNTIEQAAKEQGFVEEKTFTPEDMMKIYESI